MKWILSVLTLVTIYSCSTPTRPAESQFQGMWRLDKFEAFDSLAGRWTDDSTRRGWSGYILYDGQGHMGVHLLPRGYQNFDSRKDIDSLDQDDLKALTRFYRSNFVYFANYTVSSTSIDHNRLTATEPMNWGKTLTRDFEFKGDTLILTAHESIGGQQVRLRWIKLE